MPGLQDYLYWRGDVPFSLSPFNENDILLFARIAYVPFEDIVDYDDLIPLPIASSIRLELVDDTDKFSQESDRQMLSLLRDATRYSDVRVSRYVDSRDTEAQKQFAAITFDVGTDLRVIAYRGTDATMTGWKEDFNMMFMKEVPAQYEACAYANGAYEEGKRFILCGHSKGGNLAMFSAAFCEPALQNAIESVYNFDGPGFLKETLQSQGYQKVKGRFHTYAPQGSVIGMLLEHEEEYTIVQSTGKGISGQHNINTWELTRDGYVTLENNNDQSRFWDQTFNEWLVQLPPDQRETFVETMFQALQTVEREDMDALPGKYRSAQAIIRALRKMDPEMRKPVLSTFGAFAKSVQSSALSLFSERIGSTTQVVKPGDLPPDKSMELEYK